MRALNDEFFKKFMPGGMYSKLVDRVRHDKDLDLEFRGDYINIYYQGHSILNLKQSGKIIIDAEFRLKIEDRIPDKMKTKDDVNKYIELIPYIKDNVVYRPRENSEGKRISDSRELEFEQLLIRANNLEKRINSEYIILDRQYVVTQKKRDRWDLIALRWPIDKRGPKGRDNQEGYLSVIEVKYAQNPTIQDINKQVEKYGYSLEEHLTEICADMKKILEQKIKLRLLAKTDGQLERLKKLPLVPNLNKTEIIIYLIDYNRNSDLKRRAEMAAKPKFKGDVFIALGGLALWQANLTDFGAMAKRTAKG